MKIRRPAFSAIAAGLLCASCAGAGLAQGAAPPGASDVRVYAIGELGISGYEVVSRLWSDSWRASFRVPTFPTAAEATAALQAEAARRGADGLINVSCRDQSPGRWLSRDAPAYLCYGLAIRVLPKKA